jgi:hypothetical protein
MSTTKNPVTYKVSKTDRRDIIGKSETLLRENCYNKNECEILALELQDLQFRCNDAWADFYLDKADAKGNLPPNTICHKLQEKKNELLERYRNRGGVKKRTKSKHLGKKRRRTKRR